MNYAQVVRRTLELLQQGDPRDHNPMDLLPMIAISDPGIEWDVTGAICDGSVYHGRQGLADFFRGYLGTWETWEWDVVRLVSFGATVVAEVRERGVSRTGVDVEQRHFQVWSFAGSRLVRWQVYMCLSDALGVVRDRAHARQPVS